MGKEILTFCHIEIEKTEVYWHKSQKFFRKVLVSSKMYLGE